MKVCKLCGSDCRDLGNGRYKCSGCGNVFSESDFISVKEKAEIEAAKARAAEEVRANAALEAERIKAALEEAKLKAEASNDGDGADLFDNSVNGVCEISTPTSRGSGFLIGRAGYVVTNAHVIAKNDGSSCQSCTVKLAQKLVSANVVAMGTTNKSEHCSIKDLALLKLASVPNGAKILTFGDYAKVRIGEKVFVIGNSLGQGTCITSGIVSDKMRQGRLMTDCPINGGNSGGPIFNAKGLVIGAMVASALNYDGTATEGMNYAIPSNVVIEFVKK